MLQNPKIADDVFLPAVTGTRYILEAALRHNVKRVVFTSSMSACIHPHEKPTGEVISDDTWSNLDIDVVRKNPYYKGKTMADMYCFEFI